MEYSPFKHGSQVASLPPSEVWPGAHDMHSSPPLSYLSPTSQVDSTRRLAPGPRNVSASSPRPAPCASVETRPGVFATPTRCIRAAIDASAMNSFKQREVIWLGLAKKRNFVVMGFRVPRDARPNRSTPGLGRPCESDAGFRVCRPRPCLLSARRLSTDSARFDTPSLSSPKQDACALCPEKDVYVKNININRNRDRSERPYNYKYVKSEKVKTRDLRKRMFSVAAHGS